MGCQLDYSSVASLRGWAIWNAPRNYDDMLQISMEGIRMLAKALEESSMRGVSHVYVHSEGRIDALGKKKEDTRRVSQVVGSF